MNGHHSFAASRHAGRPAPSAGRSGNHTRLVALLLAVASWTIPGCHFRSVLSEPEVLDEVAANAGQSEVLVLEAGHWQKSTPPEPGTPEGDLEIAEALFRRADYQKAEEAFAEVAKKHSENKQVRERALFMKAETQFQQGLLAKARDSYQALLKEFPASRYSSSALHRLFAIADSWLEDARKDVQAGKPDSFPNRFVRWEPGRKPVFDIDGHAVKVLEYIREREPNGPLADDSLMMSAGYQFSTGHYERADHYYDQLIHDYPKSEYQPEAHVLAAEAKLLTYQGAKYDGRKLEEAKRILQAALRQYPDKLEAERQRIYHKLESIRREQARREFQVGDWYRHIGKPKSARFYFNWVLQNFPDTKWAELAKQRLHELAPEQPPAAEDDQSLPNQQSQETAPADENHNHTPNAPHL